MIVHSMSLQEIRLELSDDLNTLGGKVNRILKEFKRMVIKANSFPYFRTYEVVSNEKKNKFLITLSVKKKSQREDPDIAFWGVYTRPEGMYAVSLSIIDEKARVFPPHFFQRYRDRIIKNSKLSSVELIKHFVNSNWAMSYAIPTREMYEVYESIEGRKDDSQLNILGACADGYCFAEKQDEIYLMKTIISHDMLFEDQKKIFSTLRNLLLDAIKAK